MLTTLVFAFCVSLANGDTCFVVSHPELTGIKQEHCEAVAKQFNDYFKETPEGKLLAIGEAKCRPEGNPA